MTTEPKKPSERIKELGDDAQRILAGLADIAAIKTVLDEEHARRQQWEQAFEAAWSRRHEP